MNLENLKNEIEQRTGVPASLLSGETPEENIAQAKAFLAYKRECAEQQPKTAREQFADWMNAKQGIDPEDTEGAALADIEEAVRVAAGGYPMTRDGGEVNNLADPRPAREKFADWLDQRGDLKFDPFKDADGWKRLL